MHVQSMMAQRASRCDLFDSFDSMRGNQQKKPKKKRHCSAGCSGYRTITVPYRQRMVPYRDVESCLCTWYLSLGTREGPRDVQVDRLFYNIHVRNIHVDLSL